jgi:AcrR family transcriptional regulator
VNAVVEAAAQVLLREGYARSTTNRIALAAGVSIGSIYQYFRDKDEIFDAMLQRKTQGVMDGLIAATPDPAIPLEDVLRGMMKLGVALQPRGPELYRLLEYMPNALFRHRLAAIGEQFVAHVKRLLEPHRDRLRVRDLDLASFIIVHSAEGIGMAAPPELCGKPLADELSDMLIRYLVDDV